MRKLFYSILLVTAVSLMLGSCSNGEYVANPTTNGNNSGNPLNPLKADQFTWSGSGLFSVKINGNLWVADTAYYWLDTNGVNRIYAYKDSFRQEITLYLANTWSGNLYNMGPKQYNMLATWIPNTLAIVIDPKTGFYMSALGNVGQMYMVTNDTMTYNGRFYCQTVSPEGDIVNLSEGYFNLTKW